MTSPFIRQNEKTAPTTVRHLEAIFHDNCQENIRNFHFSLVTVPRDGRIWRATRRDPRFPVRSSSLNGRIGKVDTRGSYSKDLLVILPEFANVLSSFRSELEDGRSHFEQRRIQTSLVPMHFPAEKKENCAQLSAVHYFNSQDATADVPRENWAAKVKRTSRNGQKRRYTNRYKEI